MVKLSSVMKTIIIICTLVILRYILLIPGGDSLGNATQNGVVAIVGALLSAFILFGKAGKTIRKEARWFYKYLIPYGMSIFVSVLYSWWIRGYSLYSLMSGVIPFLMVLFAIPLIYIFKCDGGYMKFLKTIAILEIVILVCKAFGWYFYNYGGPRLFEALALEFDVWTREGLQRVEPGQLSSVALIVSIYLGFAEGLNFKYITVTGFIITFLFIVTQARFMIAVSVATVFIMLYFMYRKQRARWGMRLILISAIFIILASGVIGQALSTASVTGKYGGSTIARINTVQHYFDMMLEQDAVFGLGLLDSHDQSARQMMTLNQYRLYYLDDIGMLGGIVRFGALSLIVYGYLFFLMLRTCYKAYKVKNVQDLAFLFGVSGYVIMSNLMMNMYDSQRAFTVPIYLAVVSFINSRIDDKTAGAKEVYHQEIGTDIVGGK